MKDDDNTYREYDVCTCPACGKRFRSLADETPECPKCGYTTYEERQEDDEEDDDDPNEIGP